ncbi:Z-ring formation inhibitor MciZ [Paenibacillus glacialis]|nr:Z-ring formation inhibitor MciZ [Paenibacillus glacialis]
MKSYRSTDSFHMVGQAWQIKIMLQQWQKQWGPHITVKELLKKIK